MEMLDDRIVLIVRNKSTIGEEDVINSNVVVYGDAKALMFKRFGHRCFFSPGPLDLGHVGLLDDRSEAGGVVLESDRPHRRGLVERADPGPWRQGHGGAVTTRRVAIYGGSFDKCSCSRSSSRRPRISQTHRTSSSTRRTSLSKNAKIFLRTEDARFEGAPETRWPAAEARVRKTRQRALILEIPRATYCLFCMIAQPRSEGGAPPLAENLCATVLEGGACPFSV